MTLSGPDAVRRAVMAGLGIAVTSKLTIGEELESRRLVRLDVRLPLPVREIHLIDHPQKHHGAACTAMIAMLATTFPRMAEAAASIGRRDREGQAKLSRSSRPSRRPAPRSL